ncbi:MAG: hypothetical protein IH945_02730 [Armatimonadetes bacterium]|nr:hypothetical protein [Armatimonadota bacterium]
MAPRTARSLTLWTALAAAAFVYAAVSSSDYVDARTGIPIRFDVTDAMFPPSWHGGKVRATAVGVDEAEVDRSLQLVDTAMAKYPAGLLRENLEAVFFVKEMRFYGLKYGGTNSRDTVYIANRGVRQGFTDRYVLSTFHHELSSILLRNHASKFDAEAWRSANRDGFRYRSSGMESLKDGTADTKYDHRFHVDGFLNQYATSSLEEDFNTFAEALFIGDRRFWEIVDRFPRVERKADAILAFYGALDPGFTEEHFRDLAQ